MSYMDYWRQLGILPSDNLADLQVTIIGAGGIGSPTAFTLAKMGIPELTLYDADYVSPHNLPNQIFPLDSIGEPKVTTLQQVISAYATSNVITVPRNFDESDKLRGIVIVAVDSMSARQLIWKKARYNPNVSLFVEARMGAEVMRIHTLSPIDAEAIRWYESKLYSDKEALELPCTERAIMYTVMVIAGLLANQVKKFACMEPLSQEIIFDLKNLIFIVN